MNTSNEILERIEVYVSKLNENQDKSENSYYKYEIEKGIKYARITQQFYFSNSNTPSGSKSAHTFVDLSNGNILKADTWNRPCKKNPRGNVMNENILSGVNKYGANYLR